MSGIEIVGGSTGSSSGGGGGGGGGSGGGGGGDTGVYQGSSASESSDFRVAWLAATQLTLSELPFPALFENFVAVYEYDGDNLVKAYDITDVTYDWTWAPGADASTGVLTIDTATFDAASSFVVLMRGPKRDINAILDGFSGASIHQSPKDFSAVWASATTLTITGLEFDPNAEDIRAVVEVATGGRVRMAYSRHEWAFTWAAGAAGAGVLTIGAATMQATSTFIVFVEGPERVEHTAMMSLAMMNGGNIYKSPLHFTAVYQAATAVDLSGHPTVTDVSQFLAVKQVSNTGVITFHFPHNVMRPFSWDAINDRLTVANANFAATDVFQVVLEGTDRFANLPGNYVQSAEVNPYQLRGDDAATPLITAAQDFTAGWVDLGPEIPMVGYNKLKLWLTFDINDSTDLRVRILEKHTSAGAEEYVAVIESPGVSSVPFEAGYWELNVDADLLHPLVYNGDGCTPYLQVQIMAGVLGGGTAAQMDAAYFTRGTFAGGK